MILRKLEAIELQQIIEREYGTAVALAFKVNRPALEVVCRRHRLVIMQVGTPDDFEDMPLEVEVY